MKADMLPRLIVKPTDAATIDGDAAPSSRTPSTSDLAVVHSPTSLTVTRKGAACSCGHP